MASSKDTYESHTWRANTFAAGAWRGVGAAAVRSTALMRPVRMNVVTNERIAIESHGNIDTSTHRNIEAE